MLVRNDGNLYSITCLSNLSKEKKNNIDNKIPWHIEQIGLQYWQMIF